MKNQDSTKIISTHRKAFFNYEILEKWEAGLVLRGSEVKSLRAGKASLNEAYVGFKNGEAFLWQAHIGAYAQAGPFNHDPLRPRKLLLHREEIVKISTKAKEKGFTVIPLKLYFKRGNAKLEIGLARGKAEYDKRETIKKREADRQLRQVMKQRAR